VVTVRSADSENPRALGYPAAGRQAAGRRADLRSGRPTAALGFAPVGLVGLVLGAVSLRRVGAGTPGSCGMALIGLICGGIAVVAQFVHVVLKALLAN